MGLITYVEANYGHIFLLIIQHLKLTTIAIFISILIGVPIGIIINRYSKADKTVLAIVNIIQAIPSLALLGFFIPFFGIGIVPSVVVVVLYSLLPIIKNTYTGIKSINQDTLEAARGIGMTKMQVLFKVQIPLSLPIIMAGVRIASVTAVGLMTIAAFIGAGGLGELIFSGIQTVNTAKILAGAIPACILALIIDFLLSGVEKIVTPLSMRTNQIITKDSIKRRKLQVKLIGVASVLISLALIVNACLTLVVTQKTIVIASKNFTEQCILGNMFADLVENKTDIKVIRKLNLGGTKICFEGMTNGEIDAYVEYTGTGLKNILKLPSTGTPDEIYKTVKDEFKTKYNLDYLNPIGFNNTYAIAVRQDTAKKYNLNTISDLKNVSSTLVLAPTIEFANREDGMIGLEKEYNMSFKKVVQMDGALRYKAIENKKSDVVDAYSTDGLLKSFDLKVLEDDKHFFPPYYAVPLIRDETLKKYPELKDVMNTLSGKINDETMRDLNFEVDQNGKDAATVAMEYLQKKA